MIIDDFNVLCAVGGPTKAYPKLVVDTDRVLPDPIMFQGFQPVAWRAAKVFKDTGGVHSFQLSASDLHDVSLEALWYAAVENCLRRLVFE
jgi:hypothetical protein